MEILLYTLLLAYCVYGQILLFSLTPFSSFIFIHIIAAPLFIFFVFLNLRRQEVPPKLILALVFSAVIGPFGSLLGLCICLLLGLSAGKRSDKLWIFEHLDEEFRHKSSNYLGVHGKQRTDTIKIMPQTVIPFLDVIKWGTLKEKQRVLNKIIKNFAPVFIPVLKQALVDESNLVRVQAASTLISLEKLFTDEEMYLQTECKENPSPLLLRSLAELRSKRAESGTLDPISERETLSKAVSEILAFTKLFPNDASAKESAIKILYQAGQYKFASMLLAEECIDEVAAKTNKLKMYAECLFQLQEYDQVGHILTKLNARHQCPDEVFSCWTNNKKGNLTDVSAL